MGLHQAPYLGRLALGPPRGLSKVCTRASGNQASPVSLRRLAPEVLRAVEPDALDWTGRDGGGFWEWRPGICVSRKLPGGQVWLSCSGPLIQPSCPALSPKAQFQTSVPGWLGLASQTCFRAH